MATYAFGVSETANAKLDSQAKPGEGQRNYFAVRLAR